MTRKSLISALSTLSYRKTMLGVLLILALLAVPFVALADELVVVDDLVVVVNPSLDLGTIYNGSCGLQSASGTVTLKIKRTWESTNKNQEAFYHENDPQISYQVNGIASVLPSVLLSAQVIDLPPAWNNQDQGNLSSESVAATITVGPDGTPGSKSATVTFAATGPAHAGGGTIEKFVTVPVSWYVDSCPELWTLLGFYTPIKTGVNTVKAGSTVPVKFNLLDNAGNPVTDTAGISVRVQDTGCSAASSDETVEAPATGATGLRYDSGEEQFVFNWKTLKADSGKCYALSVSTPGGSVGSAQFQLK